MNVKEAVALAKSHILELFADEVLTNLGLEEVEFDRNEGEWVVTIGFSRPWDEPRTALAAMAAATPPRRAYKVVRIASTSHEVISVRNRDIAI